MKLTFEKHKGQPRQSAFWAQPPAVSVPMCVGKPITIVRYYPKIYLFYFFFLTAFDVHDCHTCAMTV